MTGTQKRRINALFAEWDRGDSPGFAIAVLRKGDIVYKKAFGMASLEHGVPLTTKSIFDIGSTSKQFVAFCISILESRGRLSQDDDIRKYLPEMPAYRWPITINHLLHHTSGVRDYLTLMYLAGMKFENEYPEKEIYDLIARQKKLNFKPNQEFLYSNSGYLLLGEIVKRVSGKSLRKFAEQNIFLPLGMRSTHFHDDFSEMVSRKASGYSVSAGRVSAAISLFDVVGDGGVNTTVEDLALWDRNFYSNRLAGGLRLMERILAPGVLNDGKKHDYARGLFLGEYRGLKTVSHGGAWIGYRAELLRFPEQGFSVACLANFNQAKPELLCKQVADIFLEEKMSGNATPACAPEGKCRSVGARGVSGLYGYYVPEENGGVLEILAENGRLVLSESGARHPLTPISEKRFLIPSSSCEVIFSLSPKPGVLTKKYYNKEVRYKKVVSRVVGIRESRGLAGEYFCAELGVAYKVALQKRRLVLSRKGAADGVLKNVCASLFTNGEFSLEFIGSDGRRGFCLGAGRVQSLLFKRLAAGEARCWA